jgi:hypothetical protein
MAVELKTASGAKQSLAIRLLTLRPEPSEDCSVHQLCNCMGHILAMSVGLKVDNAQQENFEMQKHAKI